MGSYTVLNAFDVVHVKLALVSVNAVLSSLLVRLTNMFDNFMSSSINCF